MEFEISCFFFFLSSETLKFAAHILLHTMYTFGSSGDNTTTTTTTTT